MSIFFKNVFFKISDLMDGHVFNTLPRSLCFCLYLSNHRIFGEILYDSVEMRVKLNRGSSQSVDTPAWLGHHQPQHNTPARRLRRQDTLPGWLNYMIWLMGMIMVYMIIILMIMTMIIVIKDNTKAGQVLSSWWKVRAVSYCVWIKLSQ